MKAIYTFLLSLFVTLPAWALKTNDLRVGLQAGQVGLLQDVGARAGGALGWGAFFNYATSSDLLFEVGLLISSHTDLKHTEIPIGFSYYFIGSEPYTFQMLAGITFITNNLNTDPFDLTSSGFGIYIGTGMDFDIIENLKCGAQLRYVKGFEQTVQLQSGQRLAALQDNYTFLFRAMYEFPSVGGKD